MSFGQIIVPLGAFCIFFLIIGSTIYVMAKGVKELKPKEKVPEVIKVVKPVVETVEKTVTKTLANGTKVILTKKQEFKKGSSTDYYAKKSSKKFKNEKKQAKYEAARDKAIAKKIFKERMKDGEDVSGSINTDGEKFTLSEHFKDNKKMK